MKDWAFVDYAMDELRVVAGCVVVSVGSSNLCSIYVYYIHVTEKMLLVLPR